MAIELAVALATLLVEDQHLVALDEGLYHLAGHLSTLDGGRTYGDVALVVQQHDAVKVYRVALLDILHVVDKELTALLDLKLLSLNLYDSVHIALVLRVIPGG